MLGSEIAIAWRARRPHDELIAVTRISADLRINSEVDSLLARIRPDIVIHAAAKVGGILDKTARPTEYLLDNLLIDTNVIGGSLDAGVPSLLYIGSAAIYPEHHRQPLIESDVLAGPLESANEGYALAKIAAIKLCEYASRERGVRYRVAVPSNLYGPNDDFSEGRGHLVAAALGKIHRARQNGETAVSIWGDGTARREFTFARDVAFWLVEQADKLADWPPVVNIGAGVDHSIRDYYDIAGRIVGYLGDFVVDSTKPTGTQRRMLDSSVAASLGWSPTTGLHDGMASTYAHYVAGTISREAL